MARMTVKGLDEYMQRLSRLTDDTEEIAKAALYEGAGTVANEVHRGLLTIPRVHGTGTPEDPLAGGMTATQRQGLLDGLGIAPFQFKKGIDTRVGFDGYNSIVTRKHPQGQPNQLVARAAESGTSWKAKSPFFRPAVNRARPMAERKMADKLKREIQKRMK